MQRKTLLTFFGAIIVLLLLMGTCSAGVVAGAALTNRDKWPVSALPGLPGMPIDDPVNITPQDGATPQDLEGLFKPFWQTWDLINEMYVDQPVDQTVLMRGAIKGMLESLGDEHSSYLDPKMFELSQANLEGQEYEGIGAWVNITKEYLTIIAPMPGSPAEAADLRPGDQVIAIDGVDMTGKDGEFVRQRVLGPEGTTVTLTIRRESVDEPFDVKVRRAAIEVPTVTGEILPEGNIAYVRLYTFGSDTSESLRSTLKELMAQNPNGLILDLRNNGGGYLQTAIEVASEFIGDGEIMHEEFGDGRRDTYEAKSGGLATDIPMVVLVNEGSASASEIVAGAIQDRARGWLVGATTFGKGSVQNYVQLENKQGAVRVTVARWLTPLGRQIHQVGLNPEFPVEITDEDFAANRDPQLDEAIRVLTENLIPAPTPIPTATPTPTPIP